MGSALAWFLNTRAGRWLAFAFTLLMAAAGVWLSGFRSGKGREQQKNQQQSLDNLRTRNKIDEEVARMPADVRRRELSRWVRDE